MIIAFHIWYFVANTHVWLCAQISTRELARVCGYGCNTERIKQLAHLKKKSNTVDEFFENLQSHCSRKTRRDKLTGDPIWEAIWHQFTDVKKGQSFRSKMLYNKRIYDAQSEKWIWQSKWVRHARRYMVHKMAEMRAMVLKWPPYLEWRSNFLARNPQICRDWHVGESRLYKERCFCVDEKVNAYCKYMILLYDKIINCMIKYVKINCRKLWESVDVSTTSRCKSW